ncbi:MAG: transposase, partial [Spirochaetota bacterium]
MRIASRIRALVLPLVVAPLLFVGFASWFAAQDGITAIARDFLSFKLQELMRFVSTQYSLLETNDLVDDEAFREAAVEAIAGHKTVNEIAGAYEVHPSQVAKWKAEALKRLPVVLSDGRKGKAEGGSESEARLYQQIGRLTMEVEYLKK